MWEKNIISNYVQYVEIHSCEPFSTSLSDTVDKSCDYGTMLLLRQKVTSHPVIFYKPMSGHGLQTFWITMFTINLKKNKKTKEKHQNVQINVLIHSRTLLAFEHFAMYPKATHPHHSYKRPAWEGWCEKAVVGPVYTACTKTGLLKAKGFCVHLNSAFAGS